MTKRLLCTAIIALAAMPVAAADFGVSIDSMLDAQSLQLFGVEKPLAASAPESAETGYRTVVDTELQLVSLAGGLKANYLTREAADSTDMMAFYPAQNPTHLITCVEGDLEEIAAGKMNPAVQSISLVDGAVTTLVRGTNSCDGIRTTPWGTVLFTEEDDAGGAYEMIDPLNVSEITITDRATGATTDPMHVSRRIALPTMAWEGIAILANGVVYGGDELRPGTDVANADGGAMFKFIPATPWTGGMIDTLDASPFAVGKTYAMQVSCYGDRVQFGQGCETGAAGWIEVNPMSVRADAAAVNATGFYRPEDLHQDVAYTGDGVRFCFTNTGNEGASNFAEVMCVVDRAPLVIPVADAEGKIAFSTEVVRFIEGDADFNSFDNLDFQPGTGNLYVIEDHPNGDIFACLPDGTDRNLKSDGCVKVLSVMDSSAEPTGFIFAPDGMTAYLSIQHSNDDAMPKVDDYGTDDILAISGFVAVSQ